MDERDPLSPVLVCDGACLARGRLYFCAPAILWRARAEWQCGQRYIFLMDTTPAMACGDYVRGPWWQQVCLWVCWGWCSVSGCEKHNDSAAGIVLSWTVLQPSKMPGQAEIKTWESEPERGRLREESPPPPGSPGTVHLPLMGHRGEEELQKGKRHCCEL